MANRLLQMIYVFEKSLSGLSERAEKSDFEILLSYLLLNQRVFIIIRHFKESLGFYIKHTPSACGRSAGILSDTSVFCQHFPQLILIAFQFAMLLDT